jgi:hypothetical protein
MADALVRRLETIRSNFGIGLYCFCLLRHLRRENIPTLDRAIVGEDGLYCVPPGKEPPAEAGNFYEIGLSGSGDLNISRASMEFAKMLLRNFTLDAFEAVKNYCEETNQRTELHAQGWYAFTRMMRNSLTHTQRWHFREYDRKRLPVSWRGKVIDISMEGIEPHFTFYDWWDGCELWQEMHDFAVTLK